MAYKPGERGTMSHYEQEEPGEHFPGSSCWADRTHPLPKKSEGHELETARPPHLTPRIKFHVRPLPQNPKRLGI